MLEDVVTNVITILRPQKLMANGIEWIEEDVQIATHKTENSCRTIPISETLKHQKLLQYKRKMLFGAKYIENDFVCPKLKGAAVITVSI